jgi:hypothetical protein
MVLVSERRPEERHDPVAHHLVDGALVAVHGIHHSLKHGIQDLARLLGVPVGEQLHRALEIGEEHGHLLALTFQRNSGREDLIGEMLGSVGLRGAELGLGGDGCGQRPAAPAAELLVAFVQKAARRTGAGE